MKRDILLGVNIDHIATLRQVRHCPYPDPVQAAMIAEAAGADGITLHLREDRRHIQDEDVRRIRGALQTRMNFEMAVEPAMLAFAAEIRPQHVCFVPERREELTTEGGLDLQSRFDRIHAAVKSMQDQGAQVSLFIDPKPKQIELAAEMGAEAIELHTGAYAEAGSEKSLRAELERLRLAASLAAKAGLIVNAGHGLHYHNVKPIAAIPELYELNIGHAIVARALFTGLHEAVRQMRQLMQEARQYHYD